jgi:hypothetical protein
MQNFKLRFLLTIADTLEASAAFKDTLTRRQKVLSDACSILGLTRVVAPVSTNKKVPTSSPEKQVGAGGGGGGTGGAGAVGGGGGGGGGAAKGPVNGQTC